MRVYRMSLPIIRITRNSPRNLMEAPPIRETKDRTPCCSSHQFHYHSMNGISHSQWFSFNEIPIICGFTVYIDMFMMNEQAHAQRLTRPHMTSTPTKCHQNECDRCYELSSISMTFDVNKITFYNLMLCRIQKKLIKT